MKRRSILLASVAGLTFGRRAAAQSKPVDRTIRVAFVLSTPPLAEMLGPEPSHPAVRILLHELRNLGYVEGRNLVLERRSAEEKFERLEPICVEARRAQARCDCRRHRGDRAGREEGNQYDPDRARDLGCRFGPGRGWPGAEPRAPGRQRHWRRARRRRRDLRQRVELLKQVAPAIRRVAYLGTALDWDSPGGRSARSAAQALGVELFRVEVDPKQYTKALDAVLRGRAEAMLTSSHPTHHNHRAEVIAFALRHRMPNMHAYNTMPPDGALMAYGAGVPYARVAAIVDRIVKGTPPSEIPVERPTRFQLLINLKTAKAIGLSIPQDVLLRADRVIE